MEFLLLWVMPLIECECLWRLIFTQKLWPFCNNSISCYHYFCIIFFLSQMIYCLQPNLSVYLSTFKHYKYERIIRVMKYLKCLFLSLSLSLTFSIKKFVYVEIKSSKGKINSQITQFKCSKWSQVLNTCLVFFQFFFLLGNLTQKLLKLAEDCIQINFKVLLTVSFLSKLFFMLVRKYQKNII